MGNNGAMTTRNIDIEAALPDVRSSPAEDGTVDLIAVRPAENQRQVVEKAVLTTDSGLEGDNWLERSSGRDEIYYETHLALMNSRFADAITPDGEGWELAGDQLYVDFDLSVDNAPPATRLKVGTATIEIAAHPHSGCAKYSKRFGREVLMTTRTDEGKRLRLRGVNARVIVPGVVRRGDSVGE